MALPFLVRVEATVNKVKPVDKATRSKPLNGKRSAKAPKGKEATAERTLRASNWSTLKKIIPGLQAQIDTPELDSFAPTKDWQRLVRKLGPDIIAAFFLDTKAIGNGEYTKFLDYVRKQVKNAT